MVGAVGIEHHPYFQVLRFDGVAAAYQIQLLILLTDVLAPRGK